MKKLIVLAIGLAFSCNTSQKVTAEQAEPQVTTNDPTTYASTITQDELKEHLYIYASDEFEGRETGTAGAKKAVAYIKSAYMDLGIPAAKGNDDYFQAVPLEMTKLPTGTITIAGENYPIGEDFITFSAEEGTYNEIVYVGYGIEDGDYSDFENIDIAGKMIMVKAGEPVNADGTYKISGTTEKSVWSNMSEAPGKRLEIAQAKGAKGMIYYDPSNYARYKGYYDYMKTNASGRMSLKSDEKAPSLILLNTVLTKKLVPEIETLNEVQTLPVEVAFNLAGTNEAVDSENVAAIIKGSEKPNEYLIISSHLDHIGITESGEINNGADDDGSGTVALLEIAEAFKEAAEKGNGPKRSIVFLHVTGEEKGLLGSQYYADSDPIFPLDQTVANLNIDMIGRIDPKREGDRNYVYLIGSDKLSSELHALSETVNTKFSQIELDYKYNDENDPNRFYYRSDHYNFAKNNIPIIFYFSGTHEDYHRPGDTPDKINYDLLENRTRLIFHTAWEVANRDGRVMVDKLAK